MFNIALGQKVIDILKNRSFRDPGLEVHLWSDVYDLGVLENGAVCIFCERPDTKQSPPKPEEILMWVRDGKITVSDLYIATDDIDEYVTTEGERYNISDIDVSFDIRADEESDKECCFAVEIKNLRFDLVDTSAIAAEKKSTAQAFADGVDKALYKSLSEPYEFKVGDKVRIVRKHEKRHEKWQNSWTSGMNRFVGDGKTYTIKQISSSGIYLTGEYGWPPESLELAQDEKLTGTNPMISVWNGLDAMVQKALDNKAAVQAELCKAAPNKSANHILFVDD